VNKRRKLIVALGAGALTVPFASFAQQSGKVWRIGFLGAGSALNTASRIDALRAGLRDLGYQEGKNIAFAFRWAEGNNEKLPELAAELVHLNVDVIVSHALPGPLAARRATASIPIVIAVGADPVAAGLATSFARPGGNVTGGTYFSEEISAKRIELLKEVTPRIRQVSVLTMTDTSGMARILQSMESAATARKVGFQRFQVGETHEFDSAFASIVKLRDGGLVIPEDVLLNLNAKAIADLAIRHRLPSVGSKEFAEAGGMIGYGANPFEMFRRSAYFIDKIFKGSKPADLPFEQATKFDLFANLKTARVLGIKIPQSILVRADKVIE